MTIEQATIFLILPACGYLIGSVPFGWVIGKIKGVDIRTVGSKNIGATNLGRTLGARFFWYAFLLDAAKGFVPMLAAALLVRRANDAIIADFMRQYPTARFEDLFPYFSQYRPLPSWAPLLTGIACVMGHLFPIWLKFKGGKGVATGFGVVLGFWPVFTLAGLIGGAFFVFMLMVYRYISLASISSSVVFVAAVAWLGGWDNGITRTYLEWGQRWPLIAVAGAFSLMIILRHRANIVRLMKGTEPKVGMSKKRD